MTSTTPDTLAAELIARPREADVVPEQRGEEAAVEIVDHHPSLRETLGDAWRSRHLFKLVAATALAAYISKYRLGATWLVLQTFMSFVGYSLIGGAVFNLHAPNGMPYFLFVMVGMMGWQLFSSTLIISARSFLRVKSLVRDLHIPLILVPIAGSSQALIRFFLFMTAYVITIVTYWATKGKLYAQLSPKYLFFAIAGLFLCLVLAWGVSLWTAPLTAHTRDVRMIIKYVTPFWMFVTPVLYPIEHLHGKTRLLAELNPLSSPIEMAKVGLLGVGSVRLYAAIWSVGLITLVFLSGVWFMNRFGHSVVGLRAGFDDEDDDDEMM